jgi:glycosyltransferase involved in cell wall biosynthesis
MNHSKKAPSDSEKINIAFAITNLSLIGPGIGLRSVIQNLDKTKYNIFVFSILKIPRKLQHSSVINDIEQEGARIVSLDFRKPFDLLSILPLLYFFKKLRITILHTHLVRAHIYGRIAGKLAKVPVILSTIHNMDHWKRSKNPYFQLATHIDRVTSSFADKIVTVSDAVSNYIQDRQGIRIERMTTIYNGIDVEMFRPKIDIDAKKKELLLDPEKTIFTFIGRLDSQKGCAYFIRAAESLLQEEISAQFLIVGDGRLRKKLERLASDSTVRQDIVFAGFRKDIPEILMCTDIFVMPSLWEGFGLSLYEAMAAGKPSIVTSIEPFLEVVQKNEIGLIVPPRDHYALHIAMATLLRKRALRDQMGTNAARLVEEKFNSATMTRQYDRLYSELLRKKLEPPVRGR